MHTVRGAMRTVTACVTTLVAGMSLILPINFAWTSGTQTMHLDLLAYMLPRAIAAGAIVAVCVAVFAATLNNAFIAWSATLAGAAILFVDHLVGRHNPGASLSTLDFLDALGGGIMLGGSAAAMLYSRPQVFGWTLGVLGSVTVAATSALSEQHGLSDPGKLAATWPAAESQPLWLTILALVLIGFGTLANLRRSPLERRSVELPLAPILAGLLLVIVTLYAAEWLARHGDGLIDITLAAGATLLAGMIGAMLLPRRDGTLILLALALAAVGGAVLPARLPGWSVAPLLVAIGLGILFGFRRPAPLTALWLLAALAAYAAATAGSAEDQSRIVVVGAALSLLSGYCFGSASPRYNPTRVLGVAVLYVPSAVLALRDHLTRGSVDDVAISPGRLSVSTGPVPIVASPCWTAVAITVGCAVGLMALRRWRAAPVVEVPMAGKPTPPGSGPVADV